MRKAHKQLDIPAAFAGKIAGNGDAQGMILTGDRGKRGCAQQVWCSKRAFPAQNTQNGIDPARSHGHAVKGDLIIIPPFAQTPRGHAEIQQT